MARCALILCLRKGQVIMAGNTFDLFVFARKRKSGLVVTKLGISRDFFPVPGRVAARTIKLDIAVRVITLGDGKNCESGSESNCQADS